MKEMLLSVWNAPSGELKIAMLIAVVVLGVLIKIADISATKRNNKMIEDMKNRRLKP